MHHTRNVQYTYPLLILLCTKFWVELDGNETAKDALSLQKLRVGKLPHPLAQDLSSTLDLTHVDETCCHDTRGVLFRATTASIQGRVSLSLSLSLSLAPCV